MSWYHGIDHESRVGHKDGGRQFCSSSDNYQIRIMQETELQDMAEQNPSCFSQLTADHMAQYIVLI